MSFLWMLVASWYSAFRQAICSTAFSSFIPKSRKHTGADSKIWKWKGETQLIFSATHASRNLVTRASLAVTLSKWLLHVSLACWGQFFRKVIHSKMAPYCLASLGSDLWGLARKHITNGRARHSGLFFQRISTIPSCTCFNSFLGMSDMCAA